MLSVIVYGRNDAHGYNLHKRAAISLNCIAELLGLPGDEIIFVDWNTPDDLPTFVEAIADTLTARCKKYLRVIRARPRHHARFADKTDLLALEGPARNVALRRCNPENKWALSTNTDMIFAPGGFKPWFSETAAGLEPGYYGLPRFELPEMFWESMERMKPHVNITLANFWGRRYHLNEVIEMAPEILFDGPGDFQLFPIDAARRIHGFDENHLLGWHLDSNIAKRLTMVLGPAKSLEGQFRGWHCGHTRAASLAHRGGRPANKLTTLFHHVDRPDIPAQAHSWGLAGEQLEEFKLGPERDGYFFHAMEAALPRPAAQPYRQAYDDPSLVPCPPDHLKAYLADLLFTFPRDAQIGFFGNNGIQGQALKEVHVALGFKKSVIDLGCCDDEFCKADICDILVGDFYPAQDSAAAAANQKTITDLHTLLRIEVERVRAGAAPRKFIMLNGAQPQIAAMLSQVTNMQEAPFSTRIRHGYVSPKVAA